MGITVESYRYRIGRFCGGGRKANCKQHATKEKYYPYTKSSDVHYRVFISSLVIIAILLETYCFLFAYQSLCNYVDDHALKCVNQPCTTGIIDKWTAGYIGSVTMAVTECQQIESLYSIYNQRLLLLSSDVELNPGPPDDTQRILDAIGEVRSDIADVKNQIQNIIVKVNEIETKQKNMDSRLNDVVTQLDANAYNTEILSSDVGELAYKYEKKCEDDDRLTKQIHYLEKESRKCNVRVFGLDDCETESHDALKHNIEQNIIKPAYPDGDYDNESIQSAWRMGAYQDDQPRMILMKCKSYAMKMKLFSLRDELRGKGIRLSSDQTNWEREALRDLVKRGMRGYFKNGKLHILPDTKHIPENTRVYRRAARHRDTDTASVLPNDDGINPNHDTDRVQ